MFSKYKKRFRKRKANNRKCNKFYTIYIDAQHNKI